MNTKNIEHVKNVLIELRQVSMSLTIETIQPVMDKYSMIFSGDNFNEIFSTDLFHYLNTIDGYKIEVTDLHELLPTVCNLLNMKLTPYKLVNEVGGPFPHSYAIKLF